MSAGVEVTVTKLDKDSIYETLNVASSWAPKNEGCRLTHLPTRSVIECTGFKRYHENRIACEERLAQILKYPT